MTNHQNDQLNKWVFNWLTVRLIELKHQFVRRWIDGFLLCRFLSSTEIVALEQAKAALFILSINIQIKQFQTNRKDR